MTIPDDLRAKYPELIELILVSESMNDEERQYWVNILPVMTPEQVQNLLEILRNERDQLKAIDKEYAKEIEGMGQEELSRKITEERRRRSTDLRKSEHASAEDEEKETEEILKKIQGE